jgi:hypothetical protein
MQWVRSPVYRARTRLVAQVVVWVWWGFMAFLGLLYMGLSFASFTQLRSVGGCVGHGLTGPQGLTCMHAPPINIWHYPTPTQGTGKVQDFTADSVIEFKTYRDNLLGSSFISAVVVLWAVLFSFLVLISRCFGDIKVMYGVMVGSVFNSAWVLLLSGMTLQSSQPLADWFQQQGVWSDFQNNTFRATYIMAYVMTVFFILSFFVLLFGRKSLGRKELQDSTPMMSHAPSSGVPPSNAYVDMGSVAMTSTNGAAASGKAGGGFLSSLRRQQQV